ncbi:hypothetical protein ACLOJK_003029 [Asimina triloba]
MLTILLLLLAISLRFSSSSLQYSIPSSPSNASFLISPVQSPPFHSLFLKDVLKGISARQGWNLDDIRVLGIDTRGARIGNSKRCEFHLRIGKSDLVFKFHDEVMSWAKVGRTRGDLFGPNFVGGYGLKKPVIKRFELEGPVELWVGREDELSLQLPTTKVLSVGGYKRESIECQGKRQYFDSGQETNLTHARIRFSIKNHGICLSNAYLGMQLNIMHTGLKRVLVSEGITVQVEGAKEVTVFHPSNMQFPAHGGLGANKAGSLPWSSGDLVCERLLPVCITGSGSLVAYRAQNPMIPIKSTFLSQDTILLLPDKCYTQHLHRNPACPISSLTSRLALLEKLLRSFLIDRILQNQVSVLLKSKITALTLVRFQLDMERDVGNNETTWEALASWRTKPKTEHVWFEVVARLESGRLKPLMLKKTKPFIEVDTVSWSSLMSNISFTQFPSVVVPPEALTLDVKW